MSSDLRKFSEFFVDKYSFANPDLINREKQIGQVQDLISGYFDELSQCQLEIWQEYILDKGSDKHTREKYEELLEDLWKFQHELLYVCFGLNRIAFNTINGHTMFLDTENNIENEVVKFLGQILVKKKID